jgi:hypothetical protein
MDPTNSLTVSPGRWEPSASVGPQSARLRTASGRLQSLLRVCLRAKPSSR